MLIPKTPITLDSGAFSRVPVLSRFEEAEALRGGDFDGDLDSERDRRERDLDREGERDREDMS